MLFITYENEIGKLDFNGGNGCRPWRIIEIDGLGLVGKTYDTAVYPAQAGQHTIAETVGARTITIQCDVLGLNGTRFEISRALQILNVPGTLVIRDSFRTYKIGARCIDSAQGERFGGYRVYALQFICDYPYFEDLNNTIVPILDLDNLIGSDVRWYTGGNDQMQQEAIEAGTWKLPCMFSLRTAVSNVLNIGDVDTEPLIKITIQGKPYVGEGSGTLIIKNQTTHQQLELNCDATEGDIVTVDIPNRKIYNQKGDNLIAYMSPTSFLGDFWIQKGNNRISVENNISEFCVVVCEFSNKYVEAVIG